jgi:hypothetical protein
VAFNAAAAPTSAGVLTLRIWVDDGAVVFLNGAEVARVNLPTTPIVATTLAVRTVDITNLNTPSITVTVPARSVVAGTNVLAVVRCVSCVV